MKVNDLLFMIIEHIVVAEGINPATLCESKFN